jgi:dehydrogenase/reductase SDR family protein 12
MQWGQVLRQAGPLLSYSWLGYRVRRLFWRPLALDFSGQHWVVTGAARGLGQALTLQALRAGARVCAVGRNPASLQQLQDAARAQGTPQLQAEVCDCALQSAVEGLVRRLAGGPAPVDVLVHNAGQLQHRLTLTAEGREASFATNLLAPWLLTEGLAQAGALTAHRPLVLCMASEGGTRQPLDLARLHIRDPARYRGLQAYGQHKRAQIALAGHWRQRLQGQGGDAYALHPGWVDTALLRTALPGFHATRRLWLRDTAAGIDTALWLAATRPPQPAGPWIWFDRRARPLDPGAGAGPDGAALRAWLQREAGSR